MKILLPILLLAFLVFVLAPAPAMADSITQAEATTDLNTVENEAQTDTAYYSGPNAQTAKTDLLAAQAAYNAGDYNTELVDLQGVITALDLPPLPDPTASTPEPSSLLLLAFRAIGLVSVKARDLTSRLRRAL